MNIQRTLEKPLEKIAKKIICKAKLQSSTKKFIKYDVYCVSESKINFYYNKKFVFTLSMLSPRNMFHSFDFLVQKLEEKMLSYASKQALKEELSKSIS